MGLFKSMKDLSSLTKQAKELPKIAPPDLGGKPMTGKSPGIPVQGATVSHSVLSIVSRLEHPDNPRQTIIQPPWALRVATGAPLTLATMLRGESRSETTRKEAKEMLDLVTRSLALLREGKPARLIERKAEEERSFSQLGLLTERTDDTGTSSTPAKK